MNDPQRKFDELLDKYNAGVEPLSNWITTDIVALIDAADAELQNRAPPDSEEYIPQNEISDDDY